MSEPSDCRVLIVEDQFFLADDAATELREAGATIVKFDEAQAQIDAHGFEVALIDIKLDDELAYPLADTSVA